MDAAGEAIKMRAMATKEYVKAATIFGKLEERFPEHNLAGLAGLRAAQNYMRAGDFEQAIVRFTKVVDTETYDDRSIRSQALYWSGLSHERLSVMKRDGKLMTEAYQIYRRTTFDFPDSKWAKYARGRLADPAFAEIIAKEDKRREKMLDLLKKKKL